MFVDGLLGMGNIETILVFNLVSVMIYLSLNIIHALHFLCY